MIEITVRTEGVTNLLRNIERKIDTEGKNLVQRLSATGVAEAKRRVPVDTSLLRNSLQLKAIQVTGGRISGGIYSNVFYAPYVEYGHTIYGKGYKPGAYYMHAAYELMLSKKDAEVQHFLKEVIKR
ncbi:HK97 gp10 family phage protein [Bacillus pseudomycoides]|uniref:HK97 gp10 family phage protein n=1 Tax=Bacillus pseudomycoides TaxID=64104 RepID=UPI000BF6AA72|nr:HK97 gp10 family phage protein [Bacillus pseudomycoides]PFY57623.1 hypothetical protein COL49_15055 [Bacillus pseudomycoides]